MQYLKQYDAEVEQTCRDLHLEIELKDKLSETDMED